MARKKLKESEKAATDLSREFMADAELVADLRDLAIKADSRISNCNGIYAIRDAARVMGCLAWEAEMATVVRDLRAKRDEAAL